MTETREIGVGLISVGWMGKLHTRAYQAMPSVYPELGLKCRLVVAGTRSSPCTIEDALETGWVAEAATLSLAEHRPVRLDEVRK